MFIAPCPRLPGSLLAAALLLACTGQLGAVTSAFVCNGTAAVPRTVRADGITELMGELVLNCSGGNPTPAGVPVPPVNVQIFLNTNITSRIVGTGSLSEATLMIDEPLPPPAARVPDNTVFVPLGTPPPQVLCTPQGSPCSIMGDGLGTPYETIPGTPTVYSGRQLSVNSVTWLAVPIDSPGQANTRVIRITNVRANACQLGTSSTLIPTEIVMFISVTGSEQVLINNPQQTVAFNVASMIVGGATGAGLDCVSQNTPLTSPNFNITVKEGFASSFKRRNIALTADTVTPPALRAQNIPGYPYNSESGFYNPALFTATPLVGLADYGTRIRITFNGIPAGAGVFVPLQVPLIDMFTTLPSVPSQPPSPLPPGIAQGRMVLIQTDQFGADLSAGAGYSAVTAVAGTSGGVPVGAVSPSATPGQGYAVYEVVNSDAFALEIATIPVSVAFTSTAGIGEITTNVSLAPAGGPLASILTADLDAPICRFCDNSSPRSGFSIGDCSAAAITSPANGSSLPGSSVSFQWSNGNGVTQYWLSVSKVGVGGGDLFNADPGPGLVTSKTINGLPTDGSTIYVRLYSHVGGNWPSLDYTYSSGGPATVTSPVNGSTLPGSSVNFQWTTGTAVTQYWLSISKVGVGGGDLYNADPGPGLVTSKTISGLPTDGSTVYVRLYSHIGATWPSVDYTYTAAGPATIISPVNGSTLPGASVNFQWTTGTGVTQYWLSISKVGVGGGELYNADPGPGLVTSKTISGLPTDGSTIYVRLYSHIGSTWPSVDYIYSAAGPATITSPVNGSTLPGSSVTFQWTTGTGVTQYWVSISKVGVGGGDLYNADPGPGLVTSKTISGLPTDGSTVYVRLYSHIGSNWPSRDYTYTAFH